MYPLRRRSKKALIGIVGGLVCLVGFILIPYPGPGWLVVFSGLAILSTEFPFATRVLEIAKGKYDAWATWLKRQHLIIRILVVALTGCVVLLTLWMVNTFGIIGALFNLPYTWLKSPLF